MAQLNAFVEMFAHTKVRTTSVTAPMTTHLTTHVTKRVQSQLFFKMETEFILHNIAYVTAHSVRQIAT